MDHVKGVMRFVQRHPVPVYATDATFRSRIWESCVSSGMERVELRPDTKFDLCGLGFQAFTVPHDSAETLAFRVETPHGPIGFATDIGTMTPKLAGHFRDCVALVIESNHSTEMLESGPYAPWMKSRISGPQGHLSNEALADFIRSDLGESVRCVVLMHLSRVNNSPEIAEMACRDALRRRGRNNVRVVVSNQDSVTVTVDLEKLSGVSRLGSSTPFHGQVDLPFA